MTVPPPTPNSPDSSPASRPMPRQARMYFAPRVASVSGTRLFCRFRARRVRRRPDRCRQCRDDPVELGVGVRGGEEPCLEHARRQAHPRSSIAVKNGPYRHASCAFASS